MSTAAHLLLAAAGMAFAAALLVAATVRLLRTGSRRYSSRLAHLGGVELAELFIFTDRTRFALWNALALLLLPGTAFLLTGSFTAVLAVTIATSLAYALRLHRSRLTLAANRVVGLGYAVPGAVIAVGILIPLATLDNWLDALMRDRFGIATGLLFTGTVAALIYAYLVRFLGVAQEAIDAGLGKITRSMDDAARSLGFGAGGTLWRVHRPLMWTSVLTAALLVFVDVMKELPATLVIRPFNFDTLATQAYTFASDERLGQAAVASLVIVAVGMLPVMLLTRTMRIRIAPVSPVAAGSQTRPATA